MTYSTVTLEEMLATESEEFRQSVKQRSAELIAEELNLREFRRLRKLTQARLSKKLKIGQEGVSRIEKRSDLYLSTLRGYVEGPRRQAQTGRRAAGSPARNPRRIRRAQRRQGRRRRQKADKKNRRWQLQVEGQNPPRCMIVKALRASHSSIASTAVEITS